MARLPPLTCLAGALATLAVASGCDGERIKLGNGALVDGAACPHAQVAASQVLWIGDSWVLVPGNQHTGVRDRARIAGAIGPADDYSIGAAAATTMAQIVGQYTAQESGPTKVKVLIMDGGTWDTIVANGSSPVTSVASTFTQFLATVAADGTVDQVIYYLMPDLAGIPGVADLRPLLLQACTESTVSCYFLDLQTVWAGHPEYTAAGTVPVPTDAGGTAIADAIWAIMQAKCIAQ